MRVLMSNPMSRPWSERPNSKANSFTDFSKKMVSVRLPAPGSLPLKNSGRS